MSEGLQSENLKSIFHEIDSKSIAIPDFQRGYVWEDDRAASLIASVLVHLSVGTLLFIKGEKNDFGTKEIGRIKSNLSEVRDNCRYLLDGQQRITTLWYCFKNIFNASKDDLKTTSSQYYASLQKRWFLVIKPKSPNSGSDIFGYENLNFNKTTIGKIEPGELLEYIHPEPLLSNKGEYTCFNQSYFNPDSLELGKDNNYKEFIKNAADKGCIPLYYLFDKINIIKSILKRIAVIRGEELEDEVNLNAEEKCKSASEEEIEKFKFKYLEEKIEKITIDDFGINNVHDLIDELKNDWFNEVFSYLESIRDATKLNTFTLPSDEIGRAIAIFTTINEGGQVLTPFDLVTAKAAKEKTSEGRCYSLPDTLTTLCKEYKLKISDSGLDNSCEDWTLDYMSCFNANGLVKDFNTSFLNFLCGLINSDCINNKKNDLKVNGEWFKSHMQLRMVPEKIISNVNMAFTGLSRAYAFLQFRCGVTYIKDIPYKLMVLPLAFCLVDDDCWKKQKKINRLEYWYWVSIFSGRYRANQNEKANEDIALLWKWLIVQNGDFKNNEESDDPIKIELENRFNNLFKIEDYCSKDLLTHKNTPYKTSSSKKSDPIEKPLLQYILSTCPTDFLPKNIYEPYKLCAWNVAGYKNKKTKITLQKITATGKIKKEDVSLSLENHHICPLAISTELGQTSDQIRNAADHVLNSPLNRTFISKRANKLIKDTSPEQYFPQINDKALDDHLAPRWGSTVNFMDKDEFVKHVVEVLEKRFELLEKALKSELNTLIGN
ncbi:MAG: DUF262 domain-containing protein [Succinivibrio sp.]|nr:DUF262 domain-containing protein [Succinivibrio sp.]